MATLRLDAYARVSSVRGRAGESFISVSDQFDSIRRWAEAQDVEIANWCEETDVSGGTMARPVLDQVVDRARSGATNGFVVARLDRFARTALGGLTLIAKLEEDHGATVHALDLPVDPTTKEGRKFRTDLLAWAEYVRDGITENWDSARGRAIRSGRTVGGCPFGYRYQDPTPKPTGPDGSSRGVIDSRLVPDAAAAPIVRELFERKVGGATWLELARWLDTAAPKPNGGHWARNTVRGMIDCRTYLGEASHGKHVNPDAHEPIVPAALWRRAQVEPGRRTPRGNYLLTGLVRCAGCGRRMRGSSGGRGSKPSTYSCQTAGCSLRYTTAVVNRLDAEVVEQFFARLDDFHLQAVEDDVLEGAQAEVETRTGEVERLAAVVPSHPAAVKAHQLALTAAEDELAEAEDRVAHLGSVASQSGSDLRTLREDWPTLPLDGQREILRASVVAVLVKRASRRTAPRPPISERVRVLFIDDEIPDGLADNGRSGSRRSWSWDDDPAPLVAAA